MPYTPVELRHVHVGRGLLGYKRAAVEELLMEVADSFETVWRERGELADHAEKIERELEQLRERERLLTQTLVAAERAANDVREQAKREAELILAEAHNEARSVTHMAQVERQRLYDETRRIEALLRGALTMLEERPPEVAEPVAEPPAAPEVEQPLEVDPPTQLRKVSGGFDWGEST